MQTINAFQSLTLTMKVRASISSAKTAALDPGTKAIIPSRKPGSFETNKVRFSPSIVSFACRNPFRVRTALILRMCDFSGDRLHSVTSRISVNICGLYRSDLE